MFTTTRTIAAMFVAGPYVTMASRRLSTNIAARSVISIPEDFYFRQLTAGRDFALSSAPVHDFARQMNNFVYVIGDKSEGIAMVIDGAWDPEAIANIVEADNLNLTTHIATHYHWDHIGGAVNGIRIPGIYDWAERGLPVYIPSQELKLAAEQTDTDESLLTPLDDGQCMSIGKYGVEFIHTPGHSPGSMCLRVTTGAEGDNTQNISDILLITGDTVFPGSCGRLDLPGSDPKIMYDSLQKLTHLDNNLPIYPGHGYGGSSSTIGKEKKSGLLRDITRTQWNQMMA